MSSQGPEPSTTNSSLYTDTLSGATGNGHGSASDFSISTVSGDISVPSSTAPSGTAQYLFQKNKHQQHHGQHSGQRQQPQQQNGKRYGASQQQQQMQQQQQRMRGQQQQQQAKAKQQRDKSKPLEWHERTQSLEYGQDIDMLAGKFGGGGNGGNHGNNAGANESKTNERVVGSYILGETIGMGGYSKVKLGRHIQTNQQVAIKIMFSLTGAKTDEKTRRHILREIEVMKTVKHDNVLRLLDFYEDIEYPERNGTKKNVSITVLEYAPCGELFDYLMFTGAFGQLATRTYAHQMMDGLHAMHKKGYAHRDLKPENLLLDGNFVLKIADFGFSRSFVDANDIICRMETTCGTKGYLAPEVLSRKPYTYKADLFTMGIIIFTTYCAFPPFQEAADTDWWWKRLSKGITYLEKSKKYLPNDPAKNKQYTVAGIKSLTSFWDNHTKRLQIDQEFQELMINMLHPLPDRRFNHQQIRNHKWYNQKIMTQQEIVDFMRDRVKKVSKSRKQKVAQMVQDRIARNGGDVPKKPNNVKRAGAEYDEKLKDAIHTQLHFNLGQSDLDHVMDQVDPNRSFLENTEDEIDMPKAGVRHCFYTDTNPVEVAARLQLAKDDIANEIKLKSDSNPADPPMPMSSDAFVISTVVCKSFPKDNITILRCVGKLHYRNVEVAIGIKQYVRAGTKYVYTDAERKHNQYRRRQTRTGRNRTDSDTDDDDEDDINHGDEKEKEYGSDDEQADDPLYLQGLLDDQTQNVSDNENETKSAETTATNSSESGSGNNGAQKAHQNQWTVVLTKLMGSTYGFESVVADILATNHIFEITKPEEYKEPQQNDAVAVAPAKQVQSN